MEHINWKKLSVFKVSDILGGMLHFEYCGELSKGQAQFMQLERGYNPKHYGFTAYDIRGGSTYWRCASKLNQVYS